MRLSGKPTRPSRRGAPAAARGDAPETIAGYEILQLIGRGGMGSVYLARQIRLDRLVALKELSPPLAAQPGFAGRFVRESRLAARLSHPAIVTVYDSFEANGLPYIAMEHVAGGSLRPLVERCTPREAQRVLDRVLDGLAHAHAAGIVHCDLKPENVLVGPDGSVKLADFGIARTVDELTRGAASHATGTEAYMAPEQAAGGTVTARSDLYSVGVMAHELLTGRLPGERSISDRRLAVWVGRLREADPEHRPESAEQARAQLQRIARRRFGAPGQALRARAAAATSGRWIRPAAAAATLVVAALGANPIAGGARDGLLADRDIRDATIVTPAPPVRITGPRIVRALATSGGARVRFRLHARRGGQRLAVRCSRRSGALFRIGTTTVRCRAGNARRVVRVVVATAPPSRAGAVRPASTPQPHVDPLPQRPSPVAPSDEPQGAAVS